MGEALCRKGREGLKCVRSRRSILRMRVREAYMYMCATTDLPACMGVIQIFLPISIILRLTLAIGPEPIGVCVSKRPCTEYAGARTRTVNGLLQFPRHLNGEDQLRFQRRHHPSQAALKISYTGNKLNARLAQHGFLR